MPVKRKISNSKTKDVNNAVVKSKTARKPKAAAPGKPDNAGKAGKNGSSGKAEKGGNAGKAGKGGNTGNAKLSLKTTVIDALADMKALDVRFLDVRGLTDIADFMVIASGTSDRHVRSVAQRVVEKAKEAGFRPHGVEGQQDADWVLIDLNEMIVHVMLPRVREFYGLEKLWDMTVAKRAARA